MASARSCDDASATDCCVGSPPSSSSQCFTLMGRGRSTLPKTWPLSALTTRAWTFIRPSRCRQLTYRVCCRRFSVRSEEHTSELQSRLHLVCRLLLEKKKKKRFSQPLHMYSYMISYNVS